MFTPEINSSLTAAADLLNTSAGLISAKKTKDTLRGPEQLAAFLARQEADLGWQSAALGAEQVEEVRAFRKKLHQAWTEAPGLSDTALELINDLLKGVGTRLVRHKDDDGNDAVEEQPVPASEGLADVMKASAAGALSRLVIEDETRRLRICKGDDCDAAIIDLTRNRSKLFCDFGNCANRAHVRAYRARKAKGKKRSGENLPLNTEESRPKEERAGERRREPKKPSAAEKADSINRPTSASARAAKEFRDKQRDELMAARKKAKHRQK